MLTLIIPVRDWPSERLAGCIQSFLALKSKLLSEIIVVDFGSREPVKAEKSKSVSVRVVRLEAEQWSLAEAINAGVLMSANRVFAKTDADILISPGSSTEFDLTAKKVAAQKMGLVVTQAVDLGSSISPRDALASLKGGRQPEGHLRPKWGQGGLVFFSRETWDFIGGFDSRFTGWGDEDNDFLERARHAGLPLGWADRSRLSIYHVWHPPTYAKPGVASQRARNKSIVNSDKSIFRFVSFPHSNVEKLVSQRVMGSISPLVTLGIATSGRPGRLRMIMEAIHSFKGQINNDFEILVVDNGSRDEDYLALKKRLGSVGWCKSLRLERLKESSIPKARNTVSSLARGRYTCIVDDDDIALPNRLGDHLRVFEKQGTLHGSHGGWIDFDESTGLIERNQGKERTIATLLKGTGKATAHPASLYRTDVMRAVPYDEAFALGSDLDLALRMAALGFEIGHTRSYLTLRRFHSTNVTLTGQSNQLSNGLVARARVLNTFGWDKEAAIANRAKEQDSEVNCINSMSLDTLFKHLPTYFGIWQLFVPVSAFGSGSGSQASPASRSARHATVQDGVPAAPRKRSSRPLLEQLYAAIPGELCMRKTGLNQTTFFRSQPISGLGKAIKKKLELERLVGFPVEIIAERQAQIDRSTPFKWRSLAVEPGTRVLRSEEFSDCSEALVAWSRLASDEDMSRLTSVVADYDQDREVFFLITSGIRGYDEIRLKKFRLEKLSGVAFEQLGTGGIRSDLNLNSRSH